MDIGGINDITIGSIPDIIGCHDRLIPAKSDPGTADVEGGWDENHFRFNYLNPPVKRANSKHTICIIVSAWQCQGGRNPYDFRLVSASLEYKISRCSGRTGCKIDSKRLGVRQSQLIW
jgi:hypothetical protein